MGESSIVTSFFDIADINAMAYQALHMGSIIHGLRLFDASFILVKGLSNLNKERAALK